MELSLREIEKLVIRSQRGNEEAFSLLFDHMYPRIRRYVDFRVNAEETEDIVADVFLRVTNNLKKYTKTPKGNFSAWVFRIAHNMVIDFYRKKRDFLQLTDPETGVVVFDVKDTALNPEERLIENEEHENVRAVLAGLSDTHREVLQLKYLEGFSHKEIAKIVGKSEGNIRVIQLRALRELRKFFPEID